MRYSLLLISCAAASAALFSGAVFSQAAADAYPSRPVTFIVASAAGGPNDQETRLYATKLTEMLGQQFLLDFKAGGGTTIGGAYVAKSKPDGYTVLVVGAGFAVYPAFYKDLSYDTIRDFAPVSLMSKAPFVVLANPGFPVKTVQEYVAYAKANPGKINWGASGAGGVLHLGPAWLHSATNTTVTFIQYKGVAPMVLDLVAGRLDMASTPFLTGMPLIKAGKVRALAVTGARRSSVLPNVPTVAEQGVAGYDLSAWLGFVAPVATPAASVNRLSESFAKVAKMPDVIATLEATGSAMVGNTPAEFRQLIVTETTRWQKIVQDNGIKLEE